MAPLPDKAVEKRLAAIEARIEQLAEVLGLKPEETATLDDAAVAAEQAVK